MVFINQLFLSIVFYGPTSFSEDLRPNILLLVAEAMSPRVGAFDDPIPITSNLDRLAKKGIRFDNVFTAEGVCAPSRAALITGVYQNTLGAQQCVPSLLIGPLQYLAVPPANVKAFPELLRRSGYYAYIDNKLDYQFSSIAADSGPFSICDDEGNNAHWRNRNHDQPFFGMINFKETHENGLFPRPA